MGDIILVGIATAFEDIPHNIHSHTELNPRKNGPKAILLNLLLRNDPYKHS